MFCVLCHVYQDVKYAWSIENQTVACNGFSPSLAACLREEETTTCRVLLLIYFEISFLFLGYPGFHGRYMGPGEQRRNPGAVQGYYAEYAAISNPSGRVGTGTRPEVPHLNTVPDFPDYNSK